MNDRQRFVATMHYQPRDRAPICDFGFWEETILAWHEQGLPRRIRPDHAGADASRFFGMDAYSGGPGGNPGLYPSFEPRVLEDRGDEQVGIDHNGVTYRIHKSSRSIPMYLDHLLKDRGSWERHFKRRFDPSDPGRYPADWDAARKVWSDPDCPYPRSVWGGSFYGWIRDMMGVEGVSYLVYDDPALFEEMVVTMTDCKVGVLQRLYAEGARFDCCSLWEDMCYNGGPLLSPEHFRRYLVPQIRRVTDILRSHGCDVIWVDCDGRIDELIPLWLEAGVNCMFPIEVGTWGADPCRFRAEYGRELLLIGGFDKHILAKDKAAIEAEIARLTPLVEEGGYIPLPDHRVPPDVPLANYLHYLHTARKVWGRGVNLKPIGKLDAPTPLSPVMPRQRGRREGACRAGRL